MKSFLFMLLLAPMTVVAQSDFEKSLAALDSAGRSLVSAKCAKPLAITKEQIKNRHIDGIVDQIWSVQCDGYFLEYYIANDTAPPRELPMRLTLTRPHKTFPVKLNVGIAESQVHMRLGAPETKKHGELQYVGMDEAGADTVTFVVKNGKVAEIRWAWDVD